MASAGPYRPCVGIALFNARGHVFVGRRKATAQDGELRHAWQMPQGGIDKGEEPEAAALRELHEETNVRSVKKLGETAGWLTYDIPSPIAGMPWKGRYVGQRQKWFAFRLTGSESEIDVENPGDGKAKPEFGEWRWEALTRVPDLIVPFKRDVYRAVAAEFAKYAAPAG